MLAVYVTSRLSEQTLFVVLIRRVRRQVLGGVNLLAFRTRLAPARGAAALFSG